MAVGCEEGWQEDNQFRDLMGEEVGSFITAELKDVSRPPLVDTLPSTTRAWQIGRLLSN